MPVRLRAAAFAVDDPATAATFWAALLGRHVTVDTVVRARRMPAT